MFFNVFYLLINVFIIYGINQVIFAVLDVSWTMGLNSDKTSEVFCINIKYLVEKQQILLFFYQIIYFCTTVAQSTKFHENCGCFWRVHPIKPERLLCEVSSNDQIPRKRFCSRGVAWTRLTKSRPNRSHRKRSYSISNIGNMMGCNHLSCVAVDPFAGELWHFEYCPTTTVRQLLIFDHMTVTVVRNRCCIPNFIKIGSCVRPPDTHNCWMSRAPLLGPLLGNGLCHGNPILADMTGTISQVSSQQVHC